MKKRFAVYFFVFDHNTGDRPSHGDKPQCRRFSTLAARDAFVVGAQMVSMLCLWDVNNDEAPAFERVLSASYRWCENGSHPMPLRAFNAANQELA